MADGPKSKLWVFLNSNFGLFMMSSIVLSFITWSYTQWTDSLEKEKVLSEKLTKLETEVSYRVQVMQNYFESECSEHSNLSRKTFKDIDDIYSAEPSYQAIFPENDGKDLHTLIWELSAVQKGNAKHPYISCFDSLLQFNAYLNRLQNQVDSQGLFYGEPVDYKKEVAMLTAKFTCALGLVDNEFEPMAKRESESASAGEEVELVGLGAQRRTVVEGVEMFRKVSDEGKAGDNVGLLLRGISKEEIKRGMVLAMPGSITPHMHFDAEVYVLAKDEGGRDTPFFNGYRPQFYFRTTEVPGSIQLPGGVEMVMPGDHITIKGELTSEIAMEEGLPFAVREGGRRVGAGIVTSLE